MARGWVEGDYCFCDRPVEVVELRMSRRGLPSLPMGKWHARYQLGEHAYAETDKAFDSRDAAQRYLLDQLWELLRRAGAAEGAVKPESRGD